MDRFLIFILLTVSSLIYSQEDPIFIKKQVDSIIKISFALAEKGQFEKALEINEFAEKFALEKVGKESAAYASCCSHHGLILYKKGNYEESEKWLIESKLIRERVIGKESSDYAFSLHNLGRLYISQGNYQKAEEYYLEAKGIREKLKGKMHSDYAASLLSLSNLYVEWGKYDKAELIIFEALDIYEKTKGKMNSDYASTLFVLGNLYEVIGKYDKAESVFFEVFSIREKVVGKEHRDYASSLNNLANLYRKQGNYEKAELLHNESKQIREKTMGKDHPDYAFSLNNLAVLYHEMGNYKKAESYYLETISIKKKALGVENLSYTRSLNNLAELYRVTGQFNQSEALQLEALALKEKVVGINHASYLDSKMNLGLLYLEMDDYEKAELIFEEIKPKFEALYGKNHPEYANYISNSASIYLKLKNYVKAEGYVEEALKVLQNNFGKSNPSYARRLNTLAKIYMFSSNGAKAEDAYRELSKINQELLTKAIYHLSEVELNFYIKRFEESQHRILSLLLLYYYEPMSLQTDFSSICYNNILFYKGFLLNSSNTIRRSALLDSSSNVVFNELKSINFRLAKEYSKPVSRRNDLEELEYKSNELEKELARTVKRFSKSIQPVEWNDVQRKLKSNEVVIEFVNFNYTPNYKTDSIIYGALVLKNNGLFPKFIPLFEEKILDKLLNDHHRFGKIAGYLNGLYKDATPFGFYNLIWGKLLEELKDITTIYYSPAGLLHRINIGAVQINNKEVLSDRFKLIELTSSRALVISDSFYMNFEKSKMNTAVLYGGIEYDTDTTDYVSIIMDTTVNTFVARGLYKTEASHSRFRVTEFDNRGREWRYLKWTEKEIISIQSVLKENKYQTSLYSAIQASEESFKNMGMESNSPRIIHITTHGFFFPDQKDDGRRSAVDGQDEAVFKISEHPLIRSGLILAGANHAWKHGKPFKEGMEDGILTAYEISQMNLSNTELVVLSACETGLGDIQGNEGVYGLQRAFKIAGAKYLIMSLWQVPDKQTSLLMTTFYKKWLNEKMTIPEAFRAAQKEMRKAGFDPYHWAGFILVE